MASSVQLSAYRNAKLSSAVGRAYFSRGELGQILSTYSRGVAAGMYRDYAIQQGGSVAGFFFFRHAAERPLYSVIKSTQGGRISYTLFAGEKRLGRSDSLIDLLDQLPKSESQLLG